MSVSHISQNISATGTTEDVRGRTADVQVKSNSFVGTYSVERLIDATSGWSTVTDATGAAQTYTDTGCNVVVSSAGRCRYRINVTAYTSGSIDVSIKRGDDSVAS